MTDETTWYWREKGGTHANGEYDTREAAIVAGREVCDDDVFMVGQCSNADPEFCAAQCADFAELLESMDEVHANGAMFDDTIFDVYNAESAEPALKTVLGAWAREHVYADTLWTWSDGGEEEISKTTGA